jgi:coenzyme F420-0:L-glutamate ligase/coenzyme F420-1:gamma-L-glutamate ligase
MTIRNGAPGIHLIPIRVARDIHAGDDLAEELLHAFQQQGVTPQKGDVLVVKHKIVSKAEGRMIALATVKPSAASRAWARRYRLDARVTEVAVAQSRRVVRRKRGVIITETHHGFVCANSGVDVSNVDGGSHALLLPQDPDKSAAKLHRALKRRLKISIPVIISDSFGRPWREGLTEVAIGVTGMQPLTDYRGRRDPHGYPLHASIEAVADELACAAGLICGKLAGTPACLVRGFAYEPGRGSAKALIRPARLDLFR